MAKLCPAGKAAAKRKFKVYPSAYANMYASAVCSGKVTPGGKKKTAKKAMGGSQVGGMTVEQVMQTIEDDTKIGTKKVPLNREEQSQSRGGGKAIQGTKFTGVK